IEVHLDIAHRIVSDFALRVLPSLEHVTVECFIFSHGSFLSRAHRREHSVAVTHAFPTHDDVVQHAWRSGHTILPLPQTCRKLKRVWSLNYPMAPQQRANPAHRACDRRGQTMQPVPQRW